MFSHLSLYPLRHRKVVGNISLLDIIKFADIDLIAVCHYFILQENLSSSENMAFKLQIKFECATLGNVRLLVSGLTIPMRATAMQRLQSPNDSLIHRDNVAEKQKLTFPVSIVSFAKTGFWQ